MGMGANLAKSLAQAKKDGIDTSALKGVDAYCKTTEEIESLLETLVAGRKEVESYVGKLPTPQPKAVKTFFANCAKLAKLWSPIAKDGEAYRTVLAKLQKATPGPDNKALLEMENITGRIDYVVAKSPFLESPDDIAKDINKRIGAKIAEEKAALDDEQKKREKVYEDLRKRYESDYIQV